MSGSTAQASSNQSSEIDPNKQQEPKGIESSDELVSRLKEVSEEAKKYRQNNAELRKQLEEINRKQLESSGDWEKAYKTKAEEAERLKSDNQGLLKAFAQKSKADKLAMEAAKRGCVDTDALLRLTNIDDIPINDKFEPESNALLAAIEKVQKERSYLFPNRAAPRVGDVVPTSTNTTPKGVDVEKLDSKQIENILIETYGKKK